MLEANLTDWSGMNLTHAGMSTSTIKTLLSEAGEGEKLIKVKVTKTRTSPWRVVIVITSYSIHYTKLYEYRSRYISR